MIQSYLDSILQLSKSIFLRCETSLSLPVSIIIFEYFTPALCSERLRVFFGVIGASLHFVQSKSYVSSYVFDLVSLSVSNGGFLSMSARMPSQIVWSSGSTFAACSLACVACCSLSFIVPFRSMLMTTCQAVRACAARRLPMSPSSATESPVGCSPTLCGFTAI